MRHSKKGKKLSRTRDQRKALLKIMATNLILREKVRTTETKAKTLKPFVEKLITKARAIHRAPDKKLSAVKLLATYLPQAARKKLTGELGVRYEKRNGGYTRITKLNPRKSDGAAMAVIELVK